MKILHDCSVTTLARINLPPNATLVTRTWKCLGCKQRWFVTQHRGGSMEAVRMWPTRTLKIKS